MITVKETNDLIRSQNKPDIFFSKDEHYSSQLQLKDAYELTDFLKYKETQEEFLRNAYHAILKRPPDFSFQETLLFLQQGLVSRKEVIHNLRYSKEGRIHSVKIYGLIPYFFYFFIRLSQKRYLRYVAELIKAVLTLPRLVQNVRILKEEIITLKNKVRLLTDELNSNK